MKDIFTPEDFEGMITATVGNSIDNIVERANSILQSRLLDKGVVVYNKAFGINWRADVENGNGVKLGPQEDDMWKALLICVEPIEKKCLKHEPHRIIEDIVCTHCGVKLVARWEAE